MFQTQAPALPRVAIEASLGGLCGRASISERYQADRKMLGGRVAAMRFARAVLQPGRAVLLDTETVSMYGPICELAAIDPSTGETLIDTLVNPGVPIAPDAQAVHGITDEQVSHPDVPAWPNVLELLTQITRTRIILAYNAEFDRTVIAKDCSRHGIDAPHLTDPRRWADVMVPRSDFAGSRRWLRNGGGHRAIGDVHQTREHLLAMGNAHEPASFHPLSMRQSA
ncbi:DNA polymerase III subunit epsilon [Mycobacteroides abscessus subsp. abscessus]|uniref:3'-5' exonuclease n=1 Tax=Mycobacteroides abscessus TaxID=36809 RepID=UPI00092CD4B6|nr:3'-5' exonuclease [Mycobacteroides abscessus]SHV18241.1 DNA polymerase III subunit epsilon [Mycobacteroides abscessus subsp. abscessus]